MKNRLGLRVFKPIFINVGPKQQSLPSKTFLVQSSVDPSQLQSRQANQQLQSNRRNDYNKSLLIKENAVYLDKSLSGIEVKGDPS